jgi:hypothetical protein
MLGRGNQTSGSRESDRLLSVRCLSRWSALALAVASTCALSSACSLLIHSSEKQCVSDADCSARGLSGTACVANLCQAIVPAAGAGGGFNDGIAGSGGKDTGIAGKPGPDASVEAGPPESVAMNAGSSAAGNTSATAGKSGMAGGSGGVTGAMAAAGAAGCSGSSCECKADADCEQTKGAGSKCVDRKCFAPEPQCAADEDCAQKGPEYVGGRCADRQCLPNPKWRCEPIPMPPATETIELKLPVIDALQLSLIANVPVSACSKLDYTCAQPLATATTGMDGNAVLKVPANFAGYIQETERRDYTPGLYFVPVIPEDRVLRNFPLIQSTAIAGLALALGSALDPARGHIMLIAEDCMGNALPGVAFSTPQADTKTVQFYVRDQVPTSSVKDTPPEGDGGYLNLPTGTIVITAKEVKTGIELATVTVLSRAGFISTLYIRPISRGTTVTGVNR